MSKDLAGKRVAVIGSGPASLTCAGELGEARMRYHRVRGAAQGGVLHPRHPRVPPAEGPRAARGVEAGRQRRVVRTNALVGASYDIDELMEERGFDAVFVGAGLPAYLGIEGEGLNGTMVASELLTMREPHEGVSLPRVRDAGVRR